MSEVTFLFKKNDQQWKNGWGKGWNTGICSILTQRWQTCITLSPNILTYIHSAVFKRHVTGFLNGVVSSSRRKLQLYTEQPEMPWRQLQLASLRECKFEPWKGPFGSLWIPLDRLACKDLGCHPAAKTDTRWHHHFMIEIPCSLIVIIPNM